MSLLVLIPNCAKGFTEANVWSTMAFAFHGKISQEGNSFYVMPTVAVLDHVAADLTGNRSCEKLGLQLFYGHLFTSKN
jgi:hypothetical protein